MTIALRLVLCPTDIILSFSGIAHWLIYDQDQKLICCLGCQETQN